MCLFKRRKQSDKALEDRKLISTNEKSIDVLIVLAGENEEFIKKLHGLKEKLKYLIPSDNVKDFDKKIKDQIEDLRIVLIKSDGQELPKIAENILTQINVLICDRNTKI